jgi:hypothetical protein
MNASLNPTSGELSSTAFPCVVLIDDFVAIKVDLVVPLSKSGGAVSGNYTGLTTDLTAPFDCGAGSTVTTGPLTLTPLLQTHDQDLDGCTDWEELGTAQTAGGLRDPFNYWDFMDTPTGPLYQRDKAVTVSDVAAITARFGANDAGGTAPINRDTDPLTTPPAAPAYHPAYDRATNALGPGNWNLDKADGASL